jgi:hypothetical protein
MLHNADHASPVAAGSGALFSEHKQAGRSPTLFMNKGITRVMITIPLLEQQIIIAISLEPD